MHVGVCSGKSTLMKYIEEGKSYTFENATVRLYNGCKYVSIGEKAVIKPIDDIGYVVDDASCYESGGMVVMKGEIVEVLKMESYSSCRNCNGKVAETGNKAIGECTKCGSKIKMEKSKQQTIARIILQDSEDKEVTIA